MAYSGATKAAEARVLLGKSLDALQNDPEVPEDARSVAGNVAQAVSALYEAEHASSELDGRSGVRHAMGSLSQTLALLQDLRSKHPAVARAAQTLSDIMARLHPLSTAPSRHPTAGDGTEVRAPAIPAPPAIPSLKKPPPPPAAVAAHEPTEEADPVSLIPDDGPREVLEANVGATTESNFYVGFSGEIAQGGIFVATYNVLPKDTLVDVLITLPGGFEARVPGQVRFICDPMDFSLEQQPGMGVQFESLSKQARELILRFIRKRAPLFFDD